MSNQNIRNEDTSLRDLLARLESEHMLTREEFFLLLRSRTPELAEYLYERADRVRRSYYGTDVYVRGLIEFSNYCRNDCYYCGIRCSNKKIERYRLSREEILLCCKEGYELGFRTFVLQSGEDPWYTPERIADIVHSIRERYPDCAITLSVGEREKEVYQLWFDAGAQRYLLRHETADAKHYRSLHPPKMSPEHRKECLYTLKEIGYQVGCGIMVGSPGQTVEHFVEDLCFMKELEPDMVGIGPFIPHRDTPFGKEPSGTLEETLFLLGLIRLMLPKVLLPATTALGTIHPQGREMGIKAGANVCMPNLSPIGVRKKYALYDNKICTGEEGAQCRNCLNVRMKSIGYEVVTGRGDPAKEPRQETGIKREASIYRS